MEIKIDVNININNLSQIIDKLLQLLYSKESSKQTEQTLITKEKIDIIKIREKVGLLIKNGNAVLVQELLKKYNAKKVTDVNIDDYEKLYNEIIKYIN